MRQADFAILAIVREAYDAALQILSLGNREDVDGDDNLYYSGDVPANNGSGSHFVVCGSPLERGNIAAATFTSRMITTWRPRRLLVADIGGGIFGRDELVLGDVVAAEALHYFELQKRVKSGNKLRYMTLMPTSSRLRGLARDVQLRDEWHREITAVRPEHARVEDEAAGDTPPPRVIPELTLGEIIVGEKLLGDPDDPLLQELMNEYDRAKAVEMEAAGVAHAVWAAQDTGGTQFLVLRGISDYANRLGNQETRDRWKPYAAQAAAAAAKAIIESEPASTGAELAPPPAHTSATEMLGEYPSRLAAAVAEDPSRPPFLLTVEVDEATWPALNMLDIVRDHRRLVVLAPAGAGKTELLRRLVRDVAVDPLPVFADLKRWTPEKSAALLALDYRSHNRDAIDLLLSVAVGDIGIEMLHRAVERQRVLFMVDGMNEVDPTVADRIVDTLNHYVRSNENVSGLVTDRTRKDRYTGDWKPVVLNPLGDDIVSSHLDSRFPAGTYAARSEEERAVLALPFFLALALEGTTPELGSRAQALERFFVEHVGLSASQVDDAAKAALDVYVHKGSRSFDCEEMKSTLGEHVWNRLTEANVISGSGPECRFEHQLYHDFLAAFAMLPVEREEWTHELLDAVTFDASSMDPLTFALAKADGAAQGDELLRALEDWNWRATVRVMSAVERERQLDVSRPLRIALLANLAEKRFDPVAASASEANDLLGRFDDEEASAMLAATNVIELAHTVADMPVEHPEDWYEAWRNLFTREQQLTSGTITELIRPADLQGWTAANVVRRFPLTEDQESELRHLYESRLLDNDSRSESIRWRAIHAMGAAKSREVVAVLLGAAAEDPYTWAKYGAIRSLMEIAAREVELRQPVLDALDGLLAGFDARERMQLVRSARQPKAADGWCETVRPLLTHVPKEDLTERQQANLQSLLDEFDDGCA